MSSLTKPNGPLPETVYWRRRALVIALALLVVVGLGGWLTRGGDASEAPAASTGDSASLVSTVGEAARSAATPQGGADSKGSGGAASQGSNKKAASKKAANKKADAGTKDAPQVTQPTEEPRGECLPSDVVVEPQVADQPAGTDIAVELLVGTEASEACLWAASEETLTLKITSGRDNIWFSSQCPQALPERSMVLRPDKERVVRMSWDARRSDEGCTRQRLWSLPGTYHLEAAALGGDPAQERFMLETPQPKSISPKPTSQKSTSKKPDAETSGKKKSAATKKSNG